MPIWRATALLTLLTILPTFAHAQWKPVEKVEHYRVSGQSGLELYRSIGEHGPKVGVGRVIAYTDFKLLWSRDYRRSRTVPARWCRPSRA